MTSHSNIKQKLITKAQNIFEKNLQTGYSKWKESQYSFISPASKEYTYQWMWDTAFHAIVLSHFDLPWAKREINNFLLAQFDDGFLPHIIFWGDKKILPHWGYIESDFSFRPRTSAITQPPAFALAVESIYEKDKDKEFLKEVLPKLAKHHKWLLQNRDPCKDFLISIISPNESGMDELPVFQIVAGFLSQDTARLHYYYRKGDFLNKRYRFNSKVILEKDYFNCKELLFNCVFIQSSRSLSRLFLEIGNRNESIYFQTIAEKAELALLEKCWNEQDEIFYSLYSKQKLHARVKTVASLIPLFLDGLKGKKLEKTMKHLLNTQEFWTPYPVPSVAKDEIYYTPTDTPFYKMKLLWRGPTWINTNWFIVKGLLKHGYKKQADHIVKQTLSMISQNGFREYYNPETGEGYRRVNFGWSTLVLDLL